jgi:hypothetical protein
MGMKILVMYKRPIRRGKENIFCTSDYQNEKERRGGRNKSISIVWSNNVISWTTMNLTVPLMLCK